MGPLGYPGPPPQVAPQDEPWPPPQWAMATQPPPPDMGPPAPPAGEPWPPPQWQVGEPNAQLGGSVQTTPTPGLETPEVSPDVLAQQHQPMAAPAPAPAPAKKGGPAPGKNTPGDPFVAGIEGVADARSRAIDQDSAAKQAEADFRSQRGQGAYMAQQLEMRQADQDYAAAKKAGQEKTAALAKEVDAVGKERIDPNRYFAGRDTVGRIVDTMALVAGGMQSAFTGHNLAAETIQRILDRDFEQQKTDLATRKGALDTKRSMLSEELAAGRDEYEARIKHSLIGYDMALKAIDSEAGKFQSPQIAAAAADRKAEIQGLALDKLQELGRYTENKAFQQQQADRQNSLGWYNAKTSRMGVEARAAKGNGAEHQVHGVMVPVMDEKTGKQAVSIEDVRDADGNRVKPTQVIDARTHQPMVDPKTGQPIYQEVEADKTGQTTVQKVQTGVDPKTKKPVYENVLVKTTPAYEPHYAANKEQAKEIGDHVEGVNEYMDAVNKLEEDSKKYGREFTHSSEGSRIYKQDRIAVMFAYQHMLGVKRMTDTDLELFNDMIPDPGHVAAWAPDGKVFGNMRAYGDRRMRHLRRRYGIPAGSIVQDTDPDSTPAPADLGNREEWRYESENEDDDEPDVDEDNMYGGGL